MSGGNHYYITALPTLGNLGDAPPIRPNQLLSHLADHADARAVASVFFLLDDLLQREAFLGGEIKDIQPAVLNDRQIRNEEPLPPCLAEEGEEDGRSIRVDRLWDRYFHHADDVARTNRSPFLKEWIGYEVAMRNALAEERAKRLGLEPTHYMVATDLGQTDEDLSGVIRDWTAASTPLAGHKVLTLARFEWLMRHDAWFSFADDELAAYGAKLMLLHQWHRLMEADAGSVKAGESSEIRERMT
jgi:hypothetical protein